MVRALSAAILAGLVAGTSWAGTGSARPPRVTGVFSDMHYSEHSGDVSGMEILIVGANEGYYAVIQVAEGMPHKPVVVPVEVDEDTVTFTVPADGPADPPMTFHGRVTSSRLEGRLGTTGRLSLRRGKSYWQ